MSNNIKLKKEQYDTAVDELLTGKYHRGEDAPQGSRKQEHPSWMPDMTAEEAGKLESIRAVCEMFGVSMTGYAIGFVLRQAGVVSAIVGVRNTKQIDTAIKAAE